MCATYLSALSPLQSLYHLRLPLYLGNEFLLCINRQVGMRKQREVLEHELDVVDFL